jgi:ATP-dependent Clp protease ATP-binding subunit ClpA
LFERFTGQARRVVVLAQEEARLLNHNFIGTEHILLGLIDERDGLAAQVLEGMGISLGAVRSQVEEIVGRGGSPPSGPFPFTPRANKVLELSLREALQLGHNYIGTEHILLGLIREGEGVAAQVLVKLGADLSRVRQQIIQLLSGYHGLGRSVILDALLDLWRGDLDRLESLLGTAARLAALAGDTRQLLALEQMVEIIDAERGEVRLKPRPPNATP